VKLPRFVHALGALVALLALGGCEARSLITAAELREHVRFLASDALRGRETGQPGVALAESYIASEFRRYGLEPLPGRPDFFVDFVLYRHTYDPDTTHLAFERGDDRITAALGESFRPFWFSKSGAVDAPVIFAGYGITAPEFGWDDYNGLDVAGKIVLVLRYEPDDPGQAGQAGRFAGPKENTRHAFFVTKARNALAHGAAGMLLFTDAAHAGAGGDDLRVSGALSLEREGRAGSGETIDLLAAHVSQDIATALLRPSGYSLAALQAAIDGGVRPATVTLGGLHATFAVSAPRASSQEVPARNVGGIVRGSDPRLAGEWIVVGAHHDHLGALPPRPGVDTVYNGADDNASGTSGVLELAQRFAAMQPKPARSIVFMTFSGEEEGLFGSRALLEQRLIPKEPIRTMVNLDMIGRNPEQPVKVFAKSIDETLRARMDAAAAPLGLTWSFAGAGSGPANSDYGPFMDAGIPFLFFFTGEHPDYHEVSDEASRLAYPHMEALVNWVAEIVENLASP
jgi:hypothetical protein